MTQTTWTGGEARRLLSRSLRGSGIEVGPGENPFPLSYAGATARSLDRWGADDNRRLFREIEPHAFGEPDVQVDLNVERLSAFADGSLDFVVSSHVLEHLVEPLGQLEDIHRVLAPGGVLLLLLPDRRRTFDSPRAPTTLEHLRAEYDAKVTELDDAHIAEFLEHVQDYWEPDDVPATEQERYDRHRQRSIHVHVWTEQEFVEVLLHCIEHLGMQWELLDRLGNDEVDDSIEFGFTLRKATVALDPSTGAAHFRAAWQDLAHRTLVINNRLAAESERRERVEGELRALLDFKIAQLEQTSDELARAKQVLANHERVLGPLRRTGAGALVRRIKR